MDLFKIFVVIFCSAGVAVAAVPAGPVKPADYKKIIVSALNVKKNDGVNREEALLLAQKYLIDNGFEKTHDITSGKVLKLNQSDHSWLVSFPSIEKKGAKRQIWVPAKDGIIVTSILK